MLSIVLDHVKKSPRAALGGAFVLCLCVVSACLYLYWPLERISVSEDTASVSGGDLQEEVLQRAIEKNAMESRGEVSPAVRSVGAPIEVAEGIVAKDRAAPEGYAYLAPADDMTKARLRADEERKPVSEERSHDVDWLGSPGAVYEVVRLAEEAQRDWAFGWVQLSGYTRLPDVASQLAEKQVEVLGSSGNLIRARLPADVRMLNEIGDLPGIAGLGVLPGERKILDEELSTNAAQYSMRDRVPVFITLMSDDEDGRWRVALEERGAEVGGFDRATRAYSANVFYGDVGVIVAADFVLSIEQERLIEPLLASAVPVMGADGVRMYSGERGVFGGVVGASVAVGVLDTGLNIHHTDIATHRSSVCGANLASFRQDIGDADLWYDFSIHGTHVTGILAGNGYTEAQHAGVAPGVRHIRFGKVFLGAGATLVDLVEGVDYMAEATSCMQNGRESAAVKPLVVNMSLGTLFASVAQGRGMLERKLDSAVWNAHQLYTISAGNSGGLGINVLSTAKNALSVGNSRDDGSISHLSSHGRGLYSSAHGRLKPNVTTVGTFVHSPLGRGSKDQYIALSGTSMSSPAMAGMAALMMDAAPDLRNQPATMRAYLMASAVRPDVWLDNPAWFPLNNTDGIGVIQEEYGMGSVSARVGLLNRDSEDGWTTGHASVVLTDGEYGYVDVTVPEGAERLDVVMTWDEPPAESVADVVLNDLDLWVDERADCEDAACGEHSSASVTDNVEWVIIRNPVAGVYRVKAVGELVYTDEARVGMAWQIIRGPAAPEISLAVDKAVLEGGGGHELVATLTVDGYVANGVDLHVNCRASDGRSVCNGLDYDAADPRPSPPWYRHALVGREDGMLVSGSGRTIYLGELAAGEVQEVKLYFAYEGDDDNARITLTASAWNASSGGTASVLLRRAGSDAPMAPELEIPSNDSFLTAKVLEDQSGSEPFNLSLATSEAGESELMMDPAQVFYDPRRPRGSVWYAWTPSETQHTVLRVDRPSGLENAPQTGLVAFQGTGDGANPLSLANLREIARSGDGSVFLKASAKKTYYLRVADRGSSVPLTLTWDGLERPANDGWRQATVLEGQDGSVAGDNKGGTLEYGEWPWGVTATVWYRWTAPSDGAWSFDAVGRSNPEKQTGHHIFVYTGEDVSSLRIVSDFRNIENASRFPAVVQAARGRTYRIAVGSPLPEFGIDPGAFDLTWEGVDLEDLEDRSGVTNDNHGDAVSLDEGMTGSQVIHRDFEAPPPILTVEPDEPAEAGVFTRWYRWTAPETRRFTWLIQDPQFTGAPHYRVAIFEGDSLDDLDFVGSTATSSETDDLMEFVVPMEKDQHYMISVGFPPRDIEVIPGQGFGRYRDVLGWGPTPENDDFDDAIALNGAQGNVTFGTHWSTRDAGEQVTSSGAFSTSDSIWYTYEADKSGWYEFYIPDIERRLTGLGVYQAVGDGGLHSLQKVVLFHSDLSLIQQRTYVKFYAEAGVQYILRIAHGFNGHPVGGNEYQLRWRETEAPVWIKYLGYVPNSGMDMQGFPVSFSEIFDMSFNTRGDALYVASEHAMIVYKRDVKTGGLTPAASHDLDSRRHFLGWDAYRTRLLSYCTEWREMAPEDYANLRLKEGRRYAAGEEKENCSGTVDVLVDASRPDGQLLHRVHRSGVDSFSIQEATGNLSHLESLVSEDLGLVDVALSPQSGYLYGANLDSLVIFEKDPETSDLTLIETDYAVDHLHALSVSDDGRYLFALERRSWPHAAKVFDLSAPSEPVLVGEFVDEGGVAGFRTCKVSDFRNGRYAVEFFCDQTYFAMEYRPGADNTAGVIRLTDVGISGWQTRYGNLPPLGAAAKVLEASPDGGHLYMASSDAARPGIDVFERVGNTIEVPEEVDETTRFRLDLLEVGFDTVQFGAFHASGGDCVSFRKATFEDVSYSIVRSRWQERRNANAPWVDIAGTEAEKKLCSYRPGGSAEYRLATEITVDSVTGRYASNVLDL